MLRLEVRNAETPIERKPSWIKTKASMGPQYNELHALVKSEGLHTVCQEAGCPNIFECWEDREATFLIGGEQCTRRCDFCQIDTGRPSPLDRDEPRRVAESVQQMQLRYSTITGVARDDLPDGGAWLYAETVRKIHELNPDTGVENLIPDFNGKPDLLREVFESRPEVLAHNVETVPRIFKRIRPAFRYERSLDVITQARDFGLVTKSNLILGMGETREEVSQAMQDLYDAGCELLTITQYLRPTKRHHPVERWVKPEEFVELRDEAVEIGLSGVMSGPLVRSSYRAGRLYQQAVEARQQTVSAEQAIKQTYTLTKRTDPNIGRILLGVFLGFAVVVGLVYWLVFRDQWYFALVVGILVGLLAAMIVFGRRGQRSAISQIEGKPGAAAAVLGMLKRGWKTEPGIAFNKQQDVVTRLVGPPGIVLIGEGNPNRLRPLLTSERRKHERVARDTTITEIVVGDGEGQVPLGRLTKHVTKLKKTQKPAQMTDVLNRLKALDASGSKIPLPKGPVPTNMKGMRQNMKGR
ncbi:hypothetical protein LUZ63_020456 [Rhynchospora breviuscula]|uniref:Lipoyl synthase, mitochondrial n=1 Tax=Rhynchospora breviuscula TaxID=2022672 RepID=A0A9P9Z8R4_9POAL|nr:hypothetical protein LUZ63_020456 [Rhynchospora breviuscula]